MELTAKVTKALAKDAWVEVRCATIHYGGAPYLQCERIKIQHHACHLCGGYLLMKADTPVEKRVCWNCGGPLEVSQRNDCWPDLVQLKGWIDDYNNLPELA